MRPIFPTKEQLEEMSLGQLRTLDVQDTDEEALLQEVISAKVTAVPPVAKVFRGDIPDIKTPEDEAKYQAIVNERAGIKEEVKAEIVIEEKKEEVLEFKCNECGKVVKTAGALRMHRGRFHRKDK